MSNPTLGANRGFDHGDDGGSVFSLNEFIESAIVPITAMVLFGVLFLNQTHIETNEKVKLAGGLELLLRLAATGAAGLLGIYGFLFVPKVRLAFLSFPGVWVLGVVLFVFGGTVLSPYKTYSFPYLVTMTAVVLFSPFAFYTLGTKRFFKTVLSTMMLTLLGSWFLYLFMPEYGVMIEHTSKTETVERMGGMSHPNVLSGVVVLMIVLLSYLWFEGKKSWKICLPLLLLCFTTMVFTGTRVALVAAVVSILVVYRRFWLRVDILPITAALGVAILLGALVLFSSEKISPVSSSLIGSATRSGDVEEITSVTGRAAIWEYCARLVAERPLIGYGPGVSKIYLAKKQYLLHPHNVVLSLAFSGGVFAGFCGLMMFLQQLFVSLGGKYRLAALVSFVIILNSLTEVAIFDYVPGTTTVIWLAAIFWPILDDGSL